MSNNTQRIAEIDTLSHAEYDQALVRAFEKNSMWTTAASSPNSPTYSVQELHEHTRRGMQNVVADLPGKKLNRYQLQSNTAIDYVAFSWLEAAAKRIHLRQWPQEEVLYFFQESMRNSLRSQCLSTTNPKNPLWGRGTKTEGFGESTEYSLDIQDKPYANDLEVLRRLVAVNTAGIADVSATKALLEKVNPFLLTLDKTLVDVTEEETRLKIYAIVRQGKFNEPEREMLRDIVTSRWLEMVPNVDKTMKAIAQDIQQEQYANTRASEIETMTEADVKEAFKAIHVQVPKVSLPEKKQILLTQEAQRLPAKQLPNMDTMPITELLQKCCLNAHLPRQHISPEQKAKIIQRLAALELRIIIHSDQFLVDEINMLLRALRNIVENLDLQYKDFPTLYYALMTSATRCQAANADYVRASI